MKSIVAFDNLMPNVSMLWDIPLLHPNSMDRYAAGLSSALCKKPPPDWSFKNLVPRDIRILRRLDGHSGRLAKFDDIFNRLMIYPFKAFCATGDLYHIIDHGYGHLAYALRSRRLVVTCHDLMTLKVAQGSIPGLQVSSSSVKKFAWVVNGLSLADAIIAVSISTKKDLMQIMGVPGHKIHVIPNGIDCNFKKLDNIEETANLRQLYNIPTHAKIIMHISGNQPNKNFEGILHILAILIHGFGLRIYLLRVGRLFKEEQRKLAFELGITKYIREAGDLNDRELVMAYNQADVMLFPSWWEGFGLPPLEAMACGTPVVASNRASLPEVVGEAGVILEPDDHLGMAKAIQRILADEEWRKTLITKGFAHSARFTWENVAKQTIEVYEQVLASSNKR